MSDFSDIRLDSTLSLLKPGSIFKGHINDDIEKPHYFIVLSFLDINSTIIISMGTSQFGKMMFHHEVSDIFMINSSEVEDFTELTCFVLSDIQEISNEDFKTCILNKKVKPSTFGSIPEDVFNRLVDMIQKSPLVKKKLKKKIKHI